MFDWFKSGNEGSEWGSEIALPGGFGLDSGQSGLLAGTLVASSMGWRKVEALSVGDRVLTFDNGMQVITDIQRQTLTFGDYGHSHPSTLPVFVPHGALYNRCDLWLMPDQGLLVESDEAQDALGDPFAVVMAHALIGFRGICQKAPEEALEATVLFFERDEVVYVQGGMLAHCPHPLDFLTESALDGDEIYTILDDGGARDMVESMVALDGGRGLAYDPEEVALLA